MIRWLLDTDHVSLHERGHPALKYRFEAIRGDEVAVSVITVEEMIRGRLAVLARRIDGQARVHAYAKFLETVSFFSSVPVVSFTSNCERQYLTLRSQGLRMGSQDMRIAATALSHGLIVVTRNSRDFERVPGLTIEDWTQ